MSVGRTNAELDAAFVSISDMFRAEARAADDRLQAAIEAAGGIETRNAGQSNSYETTVNAIRRLNERDTASIDRPQLLRALVRLGRTIGTYRRIDDEVPSPAQVREGLDKLKRAALLIRGTKLAAYVDGVATGEKPNWGIIAEQMALIEKLGEVAIRGLPQGRTAPKTIEPLQAAEPRSGVDAKTACAIVVLEAHAMLWPAETLGPDNPKGQEACASLYQAATGERADAGTYQGSGWRRPLLKAKEAGSAIEAFRQHVRMVLGMQAL